MTQLFNEQNYFDGETIYDSPYDIHDIDEPSSDILQLQPMALMPQTTSIQPSNLTTRNFAITGKGNSDERRRLTNEWFNWSICEPTGIFCRANEQIHIRVHGNTGTIAYIGSFNFPQGGHRPTPRSLTPGLNTISNPTAGLLYLNDEHAIGTTINVDVESGGVSSPLFILGRHTQADFQNMLNTMTESGIIELRGNRSLVTVSRQFGLPHVTGRNPNTIMNLIDATIENQDECSGFDANAPHERDQPNRHYKVFTEDTRPNVFMWASHFSTGYRSASVQHILDPQLYQHNGWGPWHEQGHTRQMLSWLWNSGSLIETTVNIYTMFTERDFDQYPNNRLERDGRYTVAFNYFNQANKDFHSLDVFVKLVMFWQLDLAFGRNFYPTLHRLYRTLPPEALPGMNWGDVGRQLFIYMSSLACNRNLAPFFNMWGVTPSAATLARINAFPPLQREIWRGRDTAPVVEYVMPKPSFFTTENVPTLPTPTSNESVPYLDRRRVNILTIMDLNLNAAVQVNNNSTRLWTNTNQTNQQFELLRDATTNTYTIRSLATNTFLASSAQNVTLTNTINNNSRWRIAPLALGSYLIVNLGSGRALDVESGNTTANGTRVGVWPPNNGGNQAWAFRFIDGGSEPSQTFIPPVNPIRPDAGNQGGSGGTQPTPPENTPIFANQRISISTAMNGTSLVEPSGNNLALWESRNQENQVWLFDLDATSNAYTIKNVADRRYLTEVSNQATLTDTITNTARWRVVQSTNQSYQLINATSGRTLDVVGGGTTANGTRVSTWTRNNPVTANQRWYLNTVATSPEPGTTPETGIQPPTNLRTTHQTQTSITLAWDAPRTASEALSYEVFRNGAKITNVTGTTYTDTGLAPGTTYQYTVRTHATTGHSNEAIGTTTGQVTQPNHYTHTLTGPTGNRSLAITNHGQTALPAGWQLQFNVTGFPVTTFAPASQVTSSGNQLSTTVQSPLPALGTTLIPVTAQIGNPNISNVRVNGIVAPPV